MGINIGDKLLYDQVSIIPPPVRGEVVEIYPNFIDTTYVIQWESGRKITYDQVTMITLFNNGVIKKDLETIRNEKLNNILKMIKIKTPITSNPRNTFKIRHKWMMGDSCGDLETVHYIEKDQEKDLDRLLYCCSKFKKALPGTWANILEDKTIKKCLGDEDYKWFNDKQYELDFEVITEKGRTFVSYQGFRLTFFDENGTEHSCEWISTEDWREKVINETLS